MAAATPEIIAQVHKVVQDARELFNTVRVIAKPTSEELGEILKYPKSYYNPMYVTLGPKFHKSENGDHKMIAKEKQKVINDLMVKMGAANAEWYTRAVCHRYTQAVWRHLHTARLLYAEFLVPEIDLVPILVMDGIFVCQLLRNYREYKLNNVVRGIVNNDEVMKIVKMDFLTPDNFVPIPILQELLEVTRDQTSPSQANDIVSLTRIFFEGIPPMDTLPAKIDNKEVELLDRTPHFLALVHRMISFDLKVPESPEGDYDIATASMLKDSFIKFKVDLKSNNPFDVNFEINLLRQGIFKMPRLRYCPESMRILFYFKLYEASEHLHLHPKAPTKFATDYIYLLRCLVQSSEDVAQLKKAGIISTTFPGDPTVVDTINFLCAAGSLEKSNHFRYQHVFDKVDKHCKSDRTEYMMDLMSSSCKSRRLIFVSLAVAAAFFLTNSKMSADFFKGLKAPLSSD